MSKNSKYLMVRAMSQSSSDFDIFFKNDVIAVGWSKVNFSTIKESKQLRKIVDTNYYTNRSISPTVRGIKLNEVERFKRIQNDDRIIVPYYDSIRIAYASNEELYNSTLKEGRDLANQRKVKYLKTDSGEIVTISRKELSNAFQSRLRVPGSTVRDLEEFKKEIDRLFVDKDKYSSNSVYAERYLEKKKELINTILEKIRSGDTILEAGGRGLEILVKELLETEHFSAQILSNKTFPGFADADIEAEHERLGTRLLVQVKHHSGQSNAWGASQLAEIKNIPEKYKSHKLVLVTSGNASPELKEKCVNEDIRLISGTDLTEWIIDNWENLKEKTIKKLNMSNLPNVI